MGAAEQGGDTALQPTGLQAATSRPVASKSAPAPARRPLTSRPAPADGGWWTAPSPRQQCCRHTHRDRVGSVTALRVSHPRRRQAWCPPPLPNTPFPSLEHVSAASLGLVAGLALPDAHDLALHAKLQRQQWRAAGGRGSEGERASQPGTEFHLVQAAAHTGRTKAVSSS